MNTAHAPVVWVTDEEEEAAVGQIALLGERVLLKGVSKGKRLTCCDFAVSDLDAVVVTRRVNPTLHLRLRDRGWLRVSGFSTVSVFQLAQHLAEQSAA